MPAASVRWTFLTEAEITSSPAIGADGSVYFSSTDGNLYRLKPDGTEIWRCRIGGGSDGSPVLAENGNVFIAAGHNVLIISPAGSKLWQLGIRVLDGRDPGGRAKEQSVSRRRGGSFGPRKPDGGGLWEGQVTDNLTSSPVISGQGWVYFCCGAFV